VDLAADFDLISLPQMRKARLSARPIPAMKLAGRTLIVRTDEGKFAKMHVRSGHMSAGSGEAEMTIDQFTAYEIDSCVYEAASGLKLRSGWSLDIDKARVTRAGGHLRWDRDEDGGHVLRPVNGARLLALPDLFDPADLRAVRPNPRRTRIDKLGDKPLYLRTRRGRLVRLRVAGGKRLRISELMVLDEEGDLCLRRTDLEVPAGKTLDLDSGAIGDAVHYDLRHEVGAAGSSGYLSAADAARYVPSHQFEMFKYNPLLNSNKIRNALIWRDENGIQPYDEWSDARKSQLREWLYLRETGQDFPIEGPPPVNGNNAIAFCAAWKIYLAHVVQSFWADANRKVQWRLLEASDEHLKHLFDVQELILYTDKGPKTNNMGIITPWCPVFCWEFMAENDYIGTTQWETIKHLTDWARAHLRHVWGWENDPDGPFASQEDQWRWQYGYRGFPPVDKMIEPLPGRDHVAHGCSGMTGFFGAVLRAANIPIRTGFSDFGSGKNHYRPEFFSANRYLPHGDDPYNATTLLGENIVPIHRIFYTEEDLRELIDEPDPLPGMTVGETGGHNHRARSVGLAVDYKTNWLLRLRCVDRQDGLSGPESALGIELSPFYSPEEIAQIEQDCDAEIATFPDECWTFLL
jgi:hypothetical protein